MCGRDELVRDAGLECGVSRIGDQAESGLWPGAVQVPCGAHRTDNVVAALDDDRGDVAGAPHAAQQLILPLDEPLVHEIMTLDPRDCGPDLGVAPLADLRFIRPQETRGGFPARPGPRRLELPGAVATGQPAVKGTQQVASFALRYGRYVLLPPVGEQGARPLLVEPVDFPLAQHEDPAQHHLRDGGRMRLRIGESQSRAPGPAEHQPAPDSEVSAQQFHVGDQMPGRVVVETCVWAAAAATTLVEHDDAIALGIEETACGRVRTGPGAAVDEYRRLAPRVARLLEVDLMDGRDTQPPVAIRPQGGEEAAAARNARGGGFTIHPASVAHGGRASDEVPAS